MDGGDLPWLGLGVVLLGACGELRLATDENETAK